MTPYCLYLLHHLDRSFTRDHDPHDGAQRLVVEIGSRIVKSKWDWIGMPNVRRMIPHRRWIGFDRVAGEGVNCVDEDNLIVTHGHNTDLVICANVLEHASSMTDVIALAYDLLRPGGHAIFVVPWKWREHNNPDYWRVLPDGMKALLKRRAWLWSVERKRGRYVWAVARK